MKAPKTELISRAGVHYVGFIFSIGRVIFRETGSTDVGIDGQLELVTSDYIATGLLAGIQIKSGDSFVNKETRIFHFKANKEHFKYWKGLCIPAFGIVYSPSLRTACWFDLSEQTDEIMNGHAPPVLRQVLDNRNVIDSDIGLDNLIAKIHEYYKIPIEKSSVDKLRIYQDQKNNATVLTKEAAWKRLITTFFSPDSDSEIIGEAGYALSWYFTTVSEEQKFQFKDRLRCMSIFELKHIFLAIKLAISRGRDDIVSLVSDLLAYHLNIIPLLKRLEDEGYIFPEDQWIIDQIVEYING